MQIEKLRQNWQQSAYTYFNVAQTLNNLNIFKIATLKTIQTDALEANIHKPYRASIFHDRN